MSERTKRTKRTEEESTPRKKRSINSKFLFGTLGIFVSIAAAFYFLHKFQIDRNADVFRIRAEAARERGNAREAINDYTRYLAFRPNDNDARAELGILIQDNAKTGDSLLQAFVLFEKVLLQDQGRDDIRNRLIDISIRLRRFNDAESQIQRMLAYAANRGELEFKLGLCAEAQSKLDDAAEQYQMAIDDGFRKPVVFLQLVGILNQVLDGSTKAEELIDHMVKANPESVEALLVRAEHRIRKGQFDAARRDLTKAESLDPENTEIVLLESRIPVSLNSQSGGTNGPLDELRSKLKTAIELKPADARSYARLSELERSAGNLAAAVQVLQSGIAAAENPAELLALLGDLLITRGQLAEAEVPLNRLRLIKGTSSFVEFLDARLHIAKGEFPEALKLFRKVQPQLAALPQLSELSSLYIASCFEAMGDPEEQIKELRNALRSNPQAEQTALRLAAVLQANGKTDEAIAIFSMNAQLSNLPGVPLELASLQLQRILREPPEQRDWPKLEAMVQKAAEKQDPIQTAVLRHQIMLAQGKQSEAIELLKKLFSETPSEEIASLLAGSLMTQGDFNQAGEVLDKAQEMLGDTVTLRIARAFQFIEAREEQMAERLEKLELQSDAFSKDDQFRLFSALADIYDSRGIAESRDRVRNLAAKVRPYDLRTRLRMLETAIAGGQKNAAVEHLQKLRDIAGASSPQVLAAEALLLVNSENLSSSDRNMANSLLSDLASKRPGWYRVPLMMGVLHERDGNLDLASQKYREAIDLGDRDPRDITRALSLYLRLGRYDDVERLQKQLRSDSSSTVRPLLVQMDAEVATSRGDFEKALKLVREAVPKDSKNPREHVWAGAMRERLRQPDEAEIAYREAVRLDPRQANSWTALISFLNRQKKSFESEFSEAREKSKGHTDGDDLARLFEAAGQFKVPEEYYKQQFAKDPKRAQSIVELASFYQRTGQAQQAEPYLRTLLEPARKYAQPIVLQARRALAGILVARDYGGFREALALVDANLATGIDKSTDIVVKANILATRRDLPHLREAMLLLKELDGKQKLDSQTLFVLAQLCDSLGERETASQHWKKLLGPNVESVHLASYIKRQLRTNDLDDVPPLLTQLRKLEPNIAAELTFRWHVQSGNADAGIKSLTEYLAQADPSAELQARRLYQMAELVEQVASKLKHDSPDRPRLFTAAETWYREILEKVPEATLALARLLGKTGRIPEALRLCEQVRTPQSHVEVCEIAMQVVHRPGATPEDVSQVETWLKDALTANPQSESAQVQLGEFALFNDRNQQSFDIYQSLLQQSNDNLVALNNQAWLVSMWKGEHDKAEELLDRAVRKAGPIAALLDTRGTIRLNSGKFDQALADFRDAVAMDDSPTSRFHLALAYWKLKETEAARLNYRAAIDAGFRLEDLLPLEKKTFAAAAAEMQAAMDDKP